MRITIEGHEEIIADLDKAAKLIDELRTVVYRLGIANGRFKEEETAPEATEAEERN